jgi:hypothetical protein
MYRIKKPEIFTRANPLMSEINQWEKGITIFKIFYFFNGKNER